MKEKLKRGKVAFRIQSTRFWESWGSKCKYWRFLVVIYIYIYLVIEILIYIDVVGQVNVFHIHHYIWTKVSLSF